MAPPSFAADATNVTDLPAAKLETNAVPDATRAYLQLQEQLESAQQAIERNRQQAETTATRNTEAVEAQLQALTEALIVQRTQEWEAIRRTHRFTLALGGTFAAVVFFALLLTAYFQWRAVSRLTEFSVLSQAALTLGRGAPTVPVVSDPPPVTGVITEQANTRLLGALDRLEKQILELEHTARPPLGEPNATDGAVADKNHRMALLLAKGESFLSFNKTEEALACFNEILALAPEHPEALVKKGDALERLSKIDDAIGCYDRAIAADGSLTIAYLHKGGLFNRLERYEEALQCYEQALGTQEKSHAA